MIGRDRLYEEGQPLLPGKYAGPVDFSAEEDDVRKAVRHYLYAWLFSLRRAVGFHGIPLREQRVFANICSQYCSGACATRARLENDRQRLFAC